MSDQDKTKQYNKEYYKNHKEKYLNDGEYNKKIECKICNKGYSKLNYAKHLKTVKHIRNSESNERLSLSDEEIKKLRDLISKN